jgi:hypothetical protein
MTLVASSFGVSSMGLSSICARSGIILYAIQLCLALLINYCSYYAFLYLTNKKGIQSFQDLSKLMLGRFHLFAIISLIVCNVGNMVGNLMIFSKYLQDLFK